MLETFDIFVLTCDKSIHCCDIFQKIYSKIKLPNSKVYFLGYRQPNFKLLDNFYFISLNSVDPGPKCSTQIKQFFQSYNKDYFILTVDDHIPIIQNNKYADKIYNFIFKEGNVGRYGLTHDVELSTQYSNYKTVEDMDFIVVNQNSQYRLSLVWSIWHKNFLLNNLIDNQNLWQFETNYNTLNIDTNKVYSVKNYNNCFIDTSHLYKQGNFKKNTYMYSTYSKKLINSEYVDIIDSVVKK